jgi:DNA/RNA endonuclease G (NUC1)
MKRTALAALFRASVVTAGTLLLSCGQGPTEPRVGNDAAIPIARSMSIGATPSVVISQVYGGGGNAGAVYKNDFIELFNPGTTPVSVAGWSVQYNSATSTSTTWQVTAINGTIPAGGYFLVQEAVGAGGTTSLPTPDVIGVIPIAATAGKVILAQTTVAFTVACPTGGSLVDLVPFGSTANCTSPTPTLTNTTAAIRGNGGCLYSGSAAADFTTAAPAPRNSATPVHTCVVGGVPVSVTLTPPTASAYTGGTQQFTASAIDGLGNSAPTTFTWTSSNPAVATVDASGIATAVGGGTTTITATSTNGIAGSATLTVTALVSHAGEVVISQVYGGGGNSGAPLSNDYIELFNRGTQPVSLNGWSVQYASSTGSFTQATPLSGTLAPGAYYLVQESSGGAAGVALPAPDATGIINMAAGAGKVIIAQTAAALGVACPSGAIAVDVVSYGSGNVCGTFAPTISNTAAALRKHAGCTYTASPSADFATGAPAPRNTASATRSCVAGPLDHVVITGTPQVLAGSTTQLTAEPLDANDNTVTGATLAWTSSDVSVATVNATGLVSGVLASGSAVTITATATVGGVTKAGTLDMQVNNPGGINWIDLSSSSASFPPGFQTQLFATARDASGGTIIPATYTFEAVDAQYIGAETRNNTGIITGIAAPADGSKPAIRITATPTAGGAPYVYVARPITIEVPSSAPTSIYANNDEFGDPTAASVGNANDMLIRRPQYVISYNQSRGTPNWVSYELDARQMVAGQDRCNCFTADPLLPAAVQIFTSDYTNGGFDRGHMTRSADRTRANVDNATTFYLTNIVPQYADLNQGVWASFENALADSTKNGRAVYIVTGPLYSRTHGLTFVKNEGKIAIPDSTWKVALIGPANGGSPFALGNVQSWNDLSGLTLLAVNMPNVTGVRNDPWSKYVTTVDRIEESTGYDFLSVLQAGFQPALDYHDRAPVAQAASSGALTEGSTLTFDATASSDPDIGRTDLGRTESLTFKWHFSDGTDATGQVVTKTVTDNGTFTATLTVTDAFGWPASSTTTLAIANLPPTATFGAPATGVEGTLFTLRLTGATDPSPVDAAALQFAFDCGAGYGAASSSATASCTEPDQGDYTVRAKVIDKDGASTEYTGVVHVVNAPPSATFVAPASVNEASPIALSLTGATDPGSADVAAGFTFAFDCGDGTGFGAASPTASASCPTTRADSRTVRARITDKDGASAEYAGTVTVANIAPTAMLTATSSTSILSGESVAVTGSFTDVGDDSPWAWVFSWGSGSPTTGSLAAPGSTDASRQYLMAGSYTITFSVTDAAGGVGTQSLGVTVSRREVTAEVNPNAINLNDQGNGDIKVTLRSSTLNIATLDLSSVRLGTVGVSKKGNGAYQAEVLGSEVQLHFDRKSLITAGVLAPGTTQITLLANLVNGVQVVAHGTVSVK